MQYVAARGRVCVLSESYSYAPFKDRVRASQAFVTACFEATCEKCVTCGKALVGKYLTVLNRKYHTEGCMGCGACGKQFELLVLPGTKQACPACESENLERLLSLFAVSLYLRYAGDRGHRDVARPGGLPVAGGGHDGTRRRVPVRASGAPAAATGGPEHVD